MEECSLSIFSTVDTEVAKLASREKLGANGPVAAKEVRVAADKSLADFEFGRNATLQTTLHADVFSKKPTGSTSSGVTASLSYVENQKGCVYEPVRATLIPFYHDQTTGVGNAMGRNELRTSLESAADSIWPTQHPFTCGIAINVSHNELSVLAGADETLKKCEYVLLDAADLRDKEKISALLNPHGYVLIAEYPNRLDVETTPLRVFFFVKKDLFATKEQMWKSNVP
jgi:hypothetical protein